MNLEKRKGLLERFGNFLIFLFPFLFFLTGVISLINSAWFDLFFCFFGLLLSAIPFHIQKKTNLNFSLWLKVFILVFIWASFTLGEMAGFYARFFWWDMLFHTCAGVVFGLLAFNLFYILNKINTSSFMVSNSFLILFSICFAISMGVFWEIGEFILDFFFKMNIRSDFIGESLDVDTMFDLIFTFIGAIIANIFVYIYLVSKNKNLKNFFNKLVQFKKFKEA